MNNLMLCFILSAVITVLFYFYNENKKENKETDVDYIMYTKVFALVFIIGYIGFYLTGSKALDLSGGGDDFLEQSYSKTVPELLPKKKFKMTKKMKGPSISVDALKLLDPVSLNQ